MGELAPPGRAVAQPKPLSRNQGTLAGTASPLHCRRRQQQLQQQHSSWEALQGDPRELLEEAGVAASSGDRWGATPAITAAAAAAAVGAQGAGPAAAAAAAVGPSGPTCTLVLPAADQRQREEEQERRRERQPGPGGATSSQVATASVAAARYYSSFELAGEAIARRIGFDRVARAEAAAAAAAADSRGPGGSAMPRPAAPAAAVPVAVPPREGDADAGGGGVEEEGIMALTVGAARLLPPTVLTSSCTDVTVPWYESAEQFWLLHDCGVPAKHLVYNKVRRAGAGLEQGRRSCDVPSGAAPAICGCVVVVLESCGVASRGRALHVLPAPGVARRLCDGLGGAAAHLGAARNGRGRPAAPRRRPCQNCEQPGGGQV